MRLLPKLFSRRRTADRTRLPRWRNFRPQLVELEARIAPAGFGTPTTIDHNLLIPALAAQDVVNVEIGSAASYDTFNLSDGQLAGDLKLSFINGFSPALGQSFQVLTASQPLTGDFAAYEGLGFYDGLYLKPVVAGNTLSLEVAKVPGGAASTTVLDVVA